MSSALIERLEKLLTKKEDEQLEFKAASQGFDSDTLIKYCVALANENGGEFILGVGDQLPRTIVGTQAFSKLERIRETLLQKLQLRIEVLEILHPQGRVLIFEVPPRPIGMPIQYKGAYWMRSGSALHPMTSTQLKKIFAESGPDFSAEICPKASLQDLDSQAIEELKIRWLKKSGNHSIQKLSELQLLRDLELLSGNKITYAALILLGSSQALAKFLAQAEVIFEYRSSQASGPAQQRQEYREGFFLYYDKLWKNINLRNDIQTYQEGLFVWDIPTFNEKVLREAILNAVSHRDYRLGGSTFIRQYPRQIEIVSPGGFPAGLTQDNILWRQAPRNRRIAEVFAKCGLVERAGQGVNLMYENCIKESKALPDFSTSDDYQVSLVLNGEIQDKQFLYFLQKLGVEQLATFGTSDLLVMDRIHHEKKLSADQLDRLSHLLDEGVIESIGRGRSRRYILSRKFYQFAGKRGVYTRKKGLDRETNKALLEKHIKSNPEGSALRELCQVIPQLSRSHIQQLLRELRSEGKIDNAGRTRSSLWQPAASDAFLAE